MEPLFEFVAHLAIFLITAMALDAFCMMVGLHFHWLIAIIIFAVIEFILWTM